MEHPDNGKIRAVLDGEEPGREDRIHRHLSECGACGDIAEAQARSWDVLTEALGVLDVDPPLSQARIRILDHANNRVRFGARARRNLPKAASFVILLTAGGAAALPGSPVRQWAQERWATLVQGEEALSPAATPESLGAPELVPGGVPDMIGATILTTSSSLDLRIQGLQGGASLRVLLVEGAQAGIFAGEGTRFTTTSEVLTASDPPGEVTVEIPLAATGVTVSVNGEAYLRKTSGGLEIFGPVRAQTPTEIRFGPVGSEAQESGPGG
jgi:hypothetical protein